MHYNVFIHSLADGHLAMVKKAAKNILAQVFVWSYIFISLNKYLQVELLGHMGGIGLTA